MDSRWIKKLPIIKQIVKLQEETKKLQEELYNYKIRLQEMETRNKENLLEAIKETKMEIKKNMEEFETKVGEDIKAEIGSAQIEMGKSIANVKAKTEENIKNAKIEIGKNIVNVKEKADENVKNAKAEMRKTVAEAKYEIGKQLQYDFIRGLSPEQYKEAMCEWYYKYTGERLDLANPGTFNQKIQWMKLYDNTALKTKLSDKYEVREWVGKVIGETYLIPLLGVWDSFDEIDFDALPGQFVLKANHGSGWNIIVNNKADFNKEKARKQFHIWLGKNYAYEGFELHYKGIEPKIIAEQYIKSGDDLYDYKFICLDEKPRYVCVYSQRFYNLRNTIFDMEWNEQPFKIDYEHSETSISKPQNFETMKALAERLCKGFSLVRIDFYNIEGRIYFGEMTFTPGNGKARIEPKEFDIKLGNMVTLPEKKMFEGKML